MQWFKNLNISKKLLSAFLFIALLAGVVGSFGYIGVDTIAKLDKEMYEDNTVPSATLGGVLSSYAYYQSTLKDFVMLDDAKVLQTNRETIESLKTSIAQSLDSLQPVLDTPEEQEQLKLIRQSHDAFIPASDEVIRLAMAGQKEEAEKLMYEKALPPSSVVVGGVYELTLQMAAESKQLFEANLVTTGSTKMFMIVISVVSVAVAVVLGLLISRMISRPIQTLVDASRKVADGDMNVVIDIRSKDEIGTLAQSFVAMTDSMNEVLHNISNASEQVASGSRQVSEASQELSQGSTEQASSIQQLTASMEQIASQTKQNAKSAEQANLLAISASADAEQGNGRMKEMLSAMERINDSSGNISKIIKVIDEIAFQTNILALNAAVEAARAGQHGKGFAVVAEEVRNLAARSANAAKETTVLIEGSIKNVEAGTRIANETAGALEKIVSGVGKAANIVGEIATASNEQAAGIEQANQGIARVSEVIQANSATSEECAAASEELSGQSEQLKEMVGKFRLKRGASSGAASFEAYAAEPASRRVRRAPSAYGEVAAASAFASASASASGKPRIRLDDEDFGKYE